ncbi:MAG: hypothetical protein A2Y07_02960 [Planctomycetes bacterium GWF2_50_10]|nr:MAG: hypothetical protein A2Y07_02960 [Planctomycetes bacterium GWF2_50_10]
MIKESKKIAVLMGGIGEERPVSLNSGKSVCEAIKQAGFDVVGADITPEDMSILDDKSIDVYFLALHGKFGEDGELQQIMEDKGLVYTGSGPKASATAFDKVASKRAFESASVKTAAMIEINNATDFGTLAGNLLAMGKKWVVKPVRQGSSVGVSIVDDAETAALKAKECFGQFGDCMVEEFIPGRELTVGILCGRALPIIEIRAKAKFYDYQAKYIDDSTEYLFDTIAERGTIAKISEAAVACFNSMGCRDFSRVDFILKDDGSAYALEINTIPGFTSHSLLPKAAAKIGLSMSELCMRIIEAASKGIR